VRDIADHGAFYWNELLTTDPEPAKSFYETVTGWSYSEMSMPGGMVYNVAKLGDTPAGGIMKMPAEMPEGVPPHWFAYIAVDDVDAAAGKVKAAGGNVLSAPFDVEGVGRIAIIQDPQGAALGLITPAAQG
jgi:predicted enzyme related to lactoylglutathione lyase